MQKFFSNFAEWISQVTGTVWVFLSSAFVIVLWIILGPIMHFSNTWQLIISTISSAVTFLMVFLIQYAQNKDTKALHLKLDELLRTTKKARKSFVNIEGKPDEILKEEKEKFDEIGNNEKSKDTR